MAGWVVGEGTDAPVGVTLKPLASVRGVGTAGRSGLAGPLGRLALGRTAALLPGHGLGAGGRAGPAPRPGPGRPAAGPAGPPLAGDLAGPVAEALAGGTVVLRLPPAEDPFPLLLAASDRLAPARRGGEAGVLVLAASARVAAALGGRLRRAGRPVAVLPGDWARARAGGCIAIGTRAAAFAPLPRLAAAVVLDAHDEVYHEERAPTWCAWEVVAERARRDGVPCVLVSPCPTLDVLDAGPLGDGAPADRAAGLAAPRDRRPAGRRPPDRALLRAAGGAGPLGVGRARTAGPVRGQPDGTGPAAGLRRLRGAGPLRPLRGGRGAGRPREGRAAGGEGVPGERAGTGLPALPPLRTGPARSSAPSAGRPG